MSTRIKLKRGTGNPTEDALEQFEVAMDVAANEIYVGSSSTDSGTDCAKLANLYEDADAVSAVESEATLDLTGQLSVTNANIPVVIQRDTNSGGGSGSLTVQRRANSDRRNNIYTSIVDRNDSDREYILYGFGGERTAAEERKFTLRMFEDTAGTPTAVIPITVESTYTGSSFETPTISLDGSVSTSQPITINTDASENNSVTANHTLDTADNFHQFVRSKLDFTSQTPYKATASYLFEAESDADGTLNIGNFGFTYQPTGKHQADFALARTFATDEFTENALTLGIEQTKIQSPVKFLPVEFVSTAPASPSAGDWYVDTDDESFYVYAGSTDGWQTVTPDTGTMVFDSTNTALKIYNGTAWVDNIDAIESNTNDLEMSGDIDMGFDNKLKFVDPSDSTNNCELFFESDGDFFIRNNRTDGTADIHIDSVTDDIFIDAGDKILVESSSFTRLRASEFNCETKMNLRTDGDISASLVIDHELATADNYHQAMRFVTDMGSQTPYDHSVVMQGETTSTANGIEVMGSLQFNYDTGGSHEIQFNSDNVKFDATDGNIVLEASNYIILNNIPTTDPTVAGALWNDSGTLKISAG